MSETPKPVDALIDLDQEIGNVQVPVTFRGKKYVLKPASEDATIRWRRAIFEATNFGPGGEVLGVKPAIADSDSILVAGCLFKVGNNDVITEGVAVEEIRGWPSLAVARLAAKAREISKMAVQAEADAHKDKLKNLLPAATGS